MRSVSGECLLIAGHQRPKFTFVSPFMHTWPQKVSSISNAISATCPLLCINTFAAQALLIGNFFAPQRVYKYGEILIQIQCILIYAYCSISKVAICITCFEFFGIDLNLVVIKFGTHSHAQLPWVREKKSIRGKFKSKTDFILLFFHLSIYKKKMQTQ